MDAATAAAQSWPDRNVQFRRSWAMPPPLKRRSPAQAATCNRANFVSNGIETDSALSIAVQRAIERALARAAALDRRADLLLTFGHHAAAERLAHLAAEMREVAR